MEIQIEVGIPIPSKSNGSNETLTSVFKRMNVGDSVTYPVKKRGGAASCAKRAGIKVTIRKISPEEVRIWRIA